MAMKGIMRNSRSQNWYKLVVEAIEERKGVDWSIEGSKGRGHPKLRIKYRGQRFTTPVPSSEKRGGCHKYLASRIRRFYRETDQAMS